MILKGGCKMTRTPSKERYEEALEVVKKYEKRQADLSKLNKDLGFHLQRFDNVKFEINRGKKEVTFAGVTKDGNLKLTKSKARSGDKFEETIGKLICVLRALSQDTSHLEKYIEQDYSGGITLRFDERAIRDVERVMEASSWNM